MMDRTIEQMLIVGSRCAARSLGCSDLLVAAAARFADVFGPLPGEIRALAVTPLPRAVGVVQISGERFRVLAVPPALYRTVPDPFHIARELPADFRGEGTLAALRWDAGPLPPRTLARVQGVLQSGDAPTLLGAAQALIDGGRVALARSQPDDTTIENIWTLLPGADRAQLTLATFANNNRLGFDLLAAPRIEGEDFARYLTEEHAGDYPEGRYESALQLAAETNDADAIDRLFARRSMSQSVRLALTLLVAGIVGGLAVKFIPWEKLR